MRFRIESSFNLRAECRINKEAQVRRYIYSKSKLNVAFQNRTLVMHLFI